MAPKKAQDKPVDPEAENRREAIVPQQRNNIVFQPSALDKSDLTMRYAYMWGKETNDHKAPHVLPGSTNPSEDEYPFFAAYFYCGLVPLLF